MIPRYQKILFVTLLLASLGMGAMLWQLRDRAHKRLVAGENSAPTEAPAVVASEQATLMVADDSTDSLTAQERLLPLPSDSGARARAILGKLLDLYAAPEASHPVSGGASGIDQVFLLPAPAPRAVRDPLATEPRNGQQPPAPSQNGPQLAVVNLTGAFVASHPSGIETESLTLLSICATLRANLPRVEQVRFLVDGVGRATLAGHADLTRTYLTAETTPAEGSTR